MKIPWSRVKDVLMELHNGPSGGHLGGQQVRQSNIEKWCRECDTCGASHGLQTRNQCQMHQYNVGAPFKRIAIDVAGPFSLRDQGNRCLLITMDYFMKWPEAYAIPN
jgi:hypothetical protein